VLHFLQFGEMAVRILAAIFLEINALILALMIVCFLLHEATALWNVNGEPMTRTDAFSACFSPNAAEHCRCRWMPQWTSSTRK
jgi:hypothetical protein